MSAPFPTLGSVGSSGRKAVQPGQLAGCDQEQVRQRGELTRRGRWAERGIGGQCCSTRLASAASLAAPALRQDSLMPVPSSCCASSPALPAAGACPASGWARAAAGSATGSGGCAGGAAAAGPAAGGEGAAAADGAAGGVDTGGVAVAPAGRWRCASCATAAAAPGCAKKVLCCARKSSAAPRKACGSDPSSPYTCSWAWQHQVRHGSTGLGQSSAACDQGMEGGTSWPGSPTLTAVGCITAAGCACISGLAFSK